MEKKTKKSSVKPSQAAFIMKEVDKLKKHLESLKSKKISGNFEELINSSLKKERV